MSFLKKLGQIMLQVAGVAAGFGPLVFPQGGAKTQAVVNDLSQIATIIVQIEAIGQQFSPNMAGSEKLRVAGPLVAQILLASDMMIGHKIQDQALAKTGASKIADGMADWLNALHPDSATAESKLA